MRRARRRCDEVARPARWRAAEGPRAQVERRAGESSRVDFSRHPPAPAVVLTGALLSAIVAGLPARKRPRARRSLAGMVLAMLCAAFAAA